MGGSDVAFVMRSYAYLARLRCIDGRPVVHADRVTTGAAKNGCYADRFLVKCVDDPKFSELVFEQAAGEPKPPLGFKLMSERGYIEYTEAERLRKKDEALALRHAESAASMDPEFGHVRALLAQLQPDRTRACAEWLEAARLAPAIPAYQKEAAKCSR